MTDSTSGRDLTRLLPTELVTEILNDLASAAIVAVSQSCRRLRTIASAHHRYWHSCHMRDSISDKSNLVSMRRLFVKRVRMLVALGLPIGIVLWFRYDTDSLNNSDTETEIDSPSDTNSDLLLDDISPTSDNAGLIRFALSAAIAPSVVNFDLGLANMSASLAYHELVQTRMPALRHLSLRVAVEFVEHWRFYGAETPFVPIPGHILGGCAPPQLRELVLMGISFAVQPRLAAPAIIIIPAFAHVTKATLFHIDLACIHHLALYIPNVVHLTLAPTLFHSLDGARSTTTISADYLRDKHVAPFGPSLKTLHLDCIDFDDGFYVIDDCESDQRYPILAQLIRRLAPHLRTISLSGLSYARVEDDEILLIDDLLDVFGPGGEGSHQTDSESSCGPVHDGDDDS